MRKGKPILNLQATISLLVCGVVVLALSVTGLLVSKNVSENTQQYLAEKAMDIARMMAHSPIVIESLNHPSEDGNIQEFANEIRRLTHVDFIVVMDMNGIRKSHPDPKEIGKHFVGGDEGNALQGREYISISTGTLGSSLRAFTPVFTPKGTQVGAVAVGITLDKVKQQAVQSQFMIYIGIGLGVLVGLLGALLSSRKIKNMMFGLEPFSIAKLLEERNAILHSVREGILAVDQDARIILVNDEAARLFRKGGIDGDLVGKNVEEYLPNTRMTNVLETGQAELDQEMDLNGITLLTNRVPLYVNGEIVGAVATFRDKTEIKLLAEQLTGVRMYAEALRAQTHEFKNKLHVILGMVQMEYYDLLPEYIQGITAQYQDEIGFITRHIKDSILAGFLLAKLSYAREVGVEIRFSEECFLPEPASSEGIHELITILGNLLDNAIEAVEESAKKQIAINFAYKDKILTIEVSDTGPGIQDEIKSRLFEKGCSSKGVNRGMGLYLVKNSLEKMGGNIEVLSEPGKGTKFTVYLPYTSKGEMG